MLLGIATKKKARQDVKKLWGRTPRANHHLAYLILPSKGPRSTLRVAKVPQDARRREQEVMKVQQEDPSPGKGDVIQVVETAP